MCFVETCNIDHLVSRSSGGKSKGKATSKGKSKKEMDLVEPTESDFLVPQPRASSDLSPEKKLKPISSPVRLYTGLDVNTSPVAKDEDRVPKDETPTTPTRSSRKRGMQDLAVEGTSPSSGKVSRVKREQD